MVFAVVVLSQLFALVLALASATPETLGEDTLRISLFVQWNGLSGAVAMCLLRPLLVRFSDSGAAVIGYLCLLLVILLVSQGTLLIDAATEVALVQVDAAVFVLRNLAVGAVVSALALRYFYVQKQWQERTRAEGEARIAALQARIRPHFLFNSMNTIASLTRARPEMAEQVVEDLSDLFRASLGDGRRLIPLDEELELARRYLEIEQLRLGDRLRVEWEIDAPGDTLLPPLTLQPLVENAVYHGIEPSKEGGLVRIEARAADGQIEITVTNPLTERPVRSGGNRFALDNTRQRLKAQFGAGATLTAQAAQGHYVTRLGLPRGAGQ